MSPERRCVLVLGMHRSGTSALARVLSILGVGLPENLVEAAASNPAGFWEPETIVRLNQAILGAAGSSWDDWQAFDPDWYSSPAASEFRMRALEALNAEFGNAPLFVLKDPRICRLAPFWLDVFGRAGVKPLIVLPLRNPLEVAASLEKRDNLAPEFGCLVWLRHVLEAEAASRGLPRFHCSYDELLTGWPQLVARAADVLKLSCPEPDESARPEIDAFLNGELRHHREEPRRVIEDKALSGWLRDTFAIFDRWAAEGENPEDFATLDRIRAAFDEAAPAFAFVKRTASATARERKIAQLEEQAQRKAALKKARDNAAREKAERERLQARLKERNGEVANLIRLTREKEAAARSRGIADALLDARELSLLPPVLRTWRQMARIRRAGIFDADWYKNKYSDVGASGMDPLRHYVRYGFAEGRAPNAAADENAVGVMAQRRRRSFFPAFLGIFGTLIAMKRPGRFDAEWYVAANPDVVASGMSPLLHYVRFGAREGRSPKPSPEFKALCGMLGMDPAATQNLLTERRRSIRERFESGVLGEMVAKAAAFEPLIAHAQRDTLAVNLPPFYADPAVPQIVAMHRLHEAAKFRRARAVIVLPDGNRPKVVAAACRLADALAGIYGPEEVVVLRADAENRDRLSGLPAGCRQINFASVVEGLPSETKERVLVEFLRSLRPDMAFNLESLLFWNSMRTYGKALASSIRLYGCLFHNEQDAQGLWRGFALERFYRTFDILAGVVAEDDALIDELVSRYSVPPGQVHKISTLENTISAISKSMNDNVGR
ncbi:hypothetical protein [Parvibaculum sp.]|uniref:sulfotransferase family protein n=1 Tax=Parvibaculum sp. TaxID=2024848 RepID=UPI0026085D82|nr:hypothetical protein [Parvibaculum sp.]MCW5726859.1 hypothetical protein [Parvibaculum sp.]